MAKHRAKYRLFKYGWQAQLIMYTNHWHYFHKPKLKKKLKAFRLTSPKR